MDEKRPDEAVLCDTQTAQECQELTQSRLAADAILLLINTSPRTPSREVIAALVQAGMRAARQPLTYGSTNDNEAKEKAAAYYRQKVARDLKQSYFDKMGGGIIPKRATEEVERQEVERDEPQPSPTYRACLARKVFEEKLHQNLQAAGIVFQSIAINQVQSARGPFLHAVVTMVSGQQHGVHVMSKKALDADKAPAHEWIDTWSLPVLLAATRSLLEHILDAAHR